MSVVVGSGVVLDGMTYVDGVLKAVENTNTLTFPESAGQTLKGRIRVPEGGATLSRLVVRTVSGVGTSAAGTYVLTASKEVDGGSTTNVMSASNENLETLTDQTEKGIPLSGTPADLIFADGDYLLLSVASDNADLTGGAGVLVSGVWAVGDTLALAFQLVDEATIVWADETHGAITGTYNDSVTGAGWSRSTPASPGTMGVVIGPTGLVFSGTAGASDQYMQLAANMSALLSNSPGHVFDPALDVVEVVNIVTDLDISVAWSWVGAFYLFDSSYVQRCLIQNAGGAKKRRLEQQGPSTNVWSTNETLTSAVISYRMHAGATLGSKYYNTATGEVTDWDSLSNWYTPKLRWSCQADIAAGDVDSLLAQVQLGFLGQTGGDTSMTVSKTIIRRFRVP